VTYVATYIVSVGWIAGWTAGTVSVPATPANMDVLKHVCL